MKPPKISLKNRIILALFMGILFPLLLALMDFTIDKELQSIDKYIFQGLIFGILMSLVMPTIMNYSAKKLTYKIDSNIKPILNENESIVAKGPANLFRGIEGVGGALFITNERVIFKSHKWNIQRGQTNILFDEVVEVHRRKTGKLIDNGLRIIDKNGVNFDFVLNEREVWLEKLNEKIK